MVRLISFLILTASVFLTCTAAQAPTPISTASCNFDAEKQLTVEYQAVAINPKKPVLGHEIPYGRVWAPGGRPLTLFTNTPLQIGGRNLEIGAYTMFVLPTSKNLTLIISKSTDTSGKYEEQQDLVRVPMESGELPSPEKSLNVQFGHVAPTECNMRMLIGTMGSWVSFMEK